MFRFYEAFLTHAESYWKELTNSTVINTENCDVADFQYLVGIHYVDPDDRFRFETIQIVVKHGLIVAYRTAVKADGTWTSMEEDSPIHVKDVVQMIQAATRQPSLVEQHSTPVDMPTDCRCTHIYCHISQAKEADHFKTYESHYA